MRIPVVYSASEIANWHVSEEYKPGKWRPARCCGFNYWSFQWIRYRVRVLWGVLVGKYDVLYWGEESGEKENTDTNYRDAKHKHFVRATGA